MRLKCSSSSTFHEIPVLRLPKAYPFVLNSSLTEFTYPLLPVRDLTENLPGQQYGYITTLSSEYGSYVTDRQSCMQRCMNAANCTMSWFIHISFDKVPNVYVCQLMVREWDRGTFETQLIEPTYQYSHMPRIWKQGQGFTDIIVSKLERPAQ